MKKKKKIQHTSVQLNLPIISVHFTHIFIYHFKVKYLEKNDQVWWEKEGGIGSANYTSLYFINKFDQ